MIADYLHEQGFHRLLTEASIFVHYEKKIVLGLFVDDFLLLGADQALISEIKQSFSQRFKMKDLGEVTYFVGLEIARDRKNKSIFIHQSSYITKLLKRFQMEESNPVTTSMETNWKPDLPDSVDESVPYKSAIGSLILPKEADQISPLLSINSPNSQLNMDQMSGLPSSGYSDICNLHGMSV